MPVYVLRDNVDLLQFQPILRILYAHSYMFNIVKIRHTGPPCSPRAWERVQRTLSRFHFIYIEPQLGIPMLQFLEHLQRTRSPDIEEDDEEDEEDDPDIRDYPEVLLTCPFCGRPFDEQDTPHPGCLTSWPSAPPYGRCLGYQAILHKNSLL